MNYKEFKEIIKKARKENKSKYYYFHGIVDNKNVKLKGYNTWLAIYNVDNVRYGSPMDIKVKKFDEYLDLPCKS